MSEQTNESKRPTHAIWQVVGEIEGKRKGRWQRVGSAWTHKDNKGMRLVFDSFPMSGRTVIREVTEQDNAQSTAATAEGGAQ
jgi:hypothetical protein